ncbi:TetR/AcrR family transcriptional regulator [Streptacidiphilus sp. P02-A3a]|uniref:TetR/AcrR family transcriptional regulator n=1 Tax=Streptacidiphilus sp. P02-A3a TaxID=2704468 RepID=UPI0015FDD1B8|nr:TetR/AcrR family transcriptional regulator [Streptacidiphilus sp. P02-A3a]QMU70812.1 TetR/AcrR family transcriptional regulator [Streptacidiphilus sp. P02-A3a]
MSTDEVAAAVPRLTRKGRATRDRIALAASNLMFERGVAATSIEDVQAAAGVNPSQVYYYFKDKRDLVRAVIAVQTEQVLGAFGSVEPRYGRLDSMEALRAWRDFAVGLEQSLDCVGGCPIGTMGSQLAETDAEARQEVAEGFARWEQAICAGLRAMRERGELRADADPDRLGLALLATLQGGLLLTQIRRDTTALEVGLDVMLDHIEAHLAH